MLVVTALPEMGEKVLVCKRNLASLYPGCWEFPSAVCEEGSLLEDVMDYELFDRLGVISAECEPYCCFSLAGNMESRHVAYKVVLSSKKIIPNGYDACNWVSINKLHKFRMVPHCVMLVKELQKK